MDWPGLAHFCLKMPVETSVLPKKPKMGCDWPRRLGLGSTFLSSEVKCNSLRISGMSKMPVLPDVLLTH